MAPVQPKTETALAAAFISNCAARNFRLQALEALEKSNIKIDSYGGCHRNRDGRGEYAISFDQYSRVLKRKVYNCIYKTVASPPSHTHTHTRKTQI